MTRTVSLAGRAALMAREGCRYEAYLDSVGVPTIGVGHTGRASAPGVHMGMTITHAEADAIFATDLRPMEAAVAVCVPGSLPQNAFDACVSLAFNIGAHGFVGSTVVHKLAAGDMAGAANAFLMWVHPPELASRRRAERAQFLRPDDPGTGAIVAVDTTKPVLAGIERAINTAGAAGVGQATAAALKAGAAAHVTLPRPAPAFAAIPATGPVAGVKRVLIADEVDVYPAPAAKPGFWAGLKAAFTSNRSA